MKKRLSESMLEEAVILRHHIHQHPEISGEEHHTAKYIKNKIREKSHEPEITDLAGEGFLVTIAGNNPGKHVGFRCELDALPLEEKNELTYRSHMEGKAHLCGHDGHMATMVLAAWKFIDEPPARGKVSFLFQPAEETGQGALMLTQQSLFPELGLDALVAFHNIPGEPLKKIITRQDVIASASVGLKVFLTGKSSHAAEPSKGVPVTPVVAHVMDFIYQIKDPINGLATVVYIKVGKKAFGSSPGAATLMATLRAGSDPALEQLKDRIVKEIKETSKKHGVVVDMEWVEYFPATKNDDKLVETVRKVAEEINFEWKERDTPFLWSEDFSYYKKYYPTVFFGLGSGKNQPALHHPTYNYPDDLIEPGAFLVEKIGRKLLED